MGFFKVLLYVAGGVGAVVLVPMTGGGSLAAAIGVMGTTTAAGGLIGVAVGGAAAAVDHAVTSNEAAREEGKQEGLREGTKAAETIYQQKYKDKEEKLLSRLKGYQNFENKLIGMYAVGLAMASADGYICAEERKELDEFVGGCMASNLPYDIKEQISKMAIMPPTLDRALEYAKQYGLPKRDIDDVIDLVANADSHINAYEEAFIKRWESMSYKYEYT